jgi:hypothetical protein
MSDGMFLSACREVSKDFPDVAYEEDLLDRVCLKVVYVPFSPPSGLMTFGLRLLPILSRTPIVSW